MTSHDFATLLEFVRTKTHGLIDTIAALPDPVAALAWQPGPGRANIGWQLMHVAATDDRHLHVRMKGGEPLEPDFAKRFGVGSGLDAQHHRERVAAAPVDLDRLGVLALAMQA